MRTSTRTALFVTSLSACIALVTAGRARAALGEPKASIEADRRALAAAPGATSEHVSYSVESMKAGSTRVREYVSPSGVVFAIAWSGVAHPNLEPLLGAYAQEYAAAMKRTRRAPGRRQQQVKTERLVVEKWGHMRDLHGRAYVPALLPSGMSVDEIR